MFTFKHRGLAKMLNTIETRHGSPSAAARRLAVGAEPDGAGTSFRVWAPDRRAVSACIEGVGEHHLSREEGGYFSGHFRGIAAGMRYWIRLDEDETLYPDPASRFQPDGPHGASEIVDGSAFAWTDAGWPGLTLKGQVVYEMHSGTFTPEGTWTSAAEKLPLLRDVGITCIEMMPIAEFPGRFGWGYDGVNLFAPSHLYGRPDDLRRFVASAHALGMGVILDVVYNHFGPDGCYLRSYAESYFTPAYENEWGDAINFHGEDAGGARDLVIANARYWTEEFHFDGLRLDATQSINDLPETHILREVAQAARDGARCRSIIVVAENERQEARLARGIESGGYGLDALWNDDFHHSAAVAMTGHNPAYYSDHRGTPQEFVSAAKYGFLFQGQRYAWQGQPRGTPALDLEPPQFVLFLENHDQVANSGWGRRIHQCTSPGRMRAFTALMLLLPGTPMLFQGQEFGSSRPFRYFADHEGELGKSVERGRKEFLAQFPHLADAPGLAAPGDPAAFEACKLDWTELERNRDIVALHRDLIAMRRTDPVFAAQVPRALDGAEIGEQAFLLRFFGARCDDRILLVNYGRDLNLESLAEPLIAPPVDRRWQLIWSSEDPRYGGSGIAPFDAEDGLFIPGDAALVLSGV